MVLFVTAFYPYLRAYEKPQQRSKVANFSPRKPSTTFIPNFFNCEMTSHDASLRKASTDIQSTPNAEGNGYLVWASLLWLHFLASLYILWWQMFTANRCNTHAYKRHRYFTQRLVLFIQSCQFFQVTQSKINVTHSHALLIITLSRSPIQSIK